MNEQQTYWQVAAGSEQRDYSQAFLNYGLAFVGGEANIATMEQVEVGDVLLLKRGKSELRAVGRVVERDGKHKGNPQREQDRTKQWLRDFDGWDLPAYCLVEWHEVPEGKRGVSGLTRGTIKRVDKQDLRTIAEQIINTIPARAVVEREPEPTEEVRDDKILEFLIRQGMRPGAAEELTATFSRIRHLARYYYEGGVAWEDVREHETRTFLVIPLLLALGWAEQQMKIELPVRDRMRADVACFSKPYNRNDGDCTLIVESKGFSQGLGYAPNQAKLYAEHFPSCRAVVVSNGYCYKAFARDDSGAFPEQPSAYLNLLCPRDRYPLNPKNVAGALEVLRLLLPQSWH